MLIGPICTRNQCGYVDDTGKICIPFTFDELGSFSDGLAWFVKNEKVGFVNERGEIVIPSIYDRGNRLCVTSDFRSGLAPVRLGANEGYIDKSGSFQIPCGFGSCSRFIGEIALVFHVDHGFAVIDQSGKLICQLPFADVAEAPYESDLIKVYPRIDGTVAPAFVDRNGVVTAGPFPDLEEVYCFSQVLPSYAVARSRINGLAGFLNRQWQITIPFNFSNVSNFSDGMAAASTQEHLWGYINSEGNWVIPPEYTDAHPFHNGTASVRKGRGKLEHWFVIDKQNQQVSPGTYDRVLNFESGFRCVWKGESIMAIDSKCNMIWSAKDGQ